MAASPPRAVKVQPLTPFEPDLFERAWCSIPHPTLPLLATVHGKVITIFSLSTLTAHSKLTAAHDRSVRTVTWKPGLPPHKLCLISGSFDSHAAIWRLDGDVPAQIGPDSDAREVEITNRHTAHEGDSDADDNEWTLTLVLEGHDSEIKCVAFSPSGAHVATCSRDKTIWIWEDEGAAEEDDGWETTAILNEHDGDVKAVAWCPDVPGRNARSRYGPDVLASASYDNTVRIWREDGDGEWVCVAVLEGHGGTVWGLEWEPNPQGNRFPRLMTFSADSTIRIWTLMEDEEDEEDVNPAGVGFASRLGRIPNTMRRSLKEDWTCSAELPPAHTRDVYSATWSKTSGLVASTGGDGGIAVYVENPAAVEPTGPETTSVIASRSHSEEAMNLDDESAVANGHVSPNPNAGTTPEAGTVASGGWRLLTTVPNAHGPYEVNHITWCKRFDHGTERRGIEEMLVTTGDDGLIRTWQVTIEA